MGDHDDYDFETEISDFVDSLIEEIENPWWLMVSVFLVGLAALIIYFY